jgi:hypothetical protein
MKKSRPNIKARTRAEVYARSGGLCERCQRAKAVHIHHLTYARIGDELLSDLQHICIWCHCEIHPDRANALLELEILRHGEYPMERIEEELPALNLGNYEASGYDIEAVEEEEKARMKAPHPARPLPEQFRLAG